MIKARKSLLAVILKTLSELDFIMGISGVRLARHSDLRILYVKSVRTKELLSWLS